jgi:hypothetical protein
MAVSTYLNFHPQRIPAGQQLRKLFKLVWLIPTQRTFAGRPLRVGGVHGVAAYIVPQRTASAFRLANRCRMLWDGRAPLYPVSTRNTRESPPGFRSPEAIRLLRRLRQPTQWLRQNLHFPTHGE